jgi:hypothetical protein
VGDPAARASAELVEQLRQRDMQLARLLADNKRKTAENMKLLVEIRLAEAKLAARPGHH